jgi:hypothetical protein
VYGDLVGQHGQSEDCLQLNLFVPRDVVSIGTGLPVMVFVPGGGFFGGSASSADGSLWLATAAALVSQSDGFVSLTMQEPSFRIRLCPVQAWCARLSVCPFWYVIWVKLNQQT